MGPQPMHQTPLVRWDNLDLTFIFNLTEKHDVYQDILSQVVDKQTEENRIILAL